MGATLNLEVNSRTLRLRTSLCIECGKETKNYIDKCCRQGFSGVVAIPASCDGVGGESILLNWRSWLEHMSRVKISL